MFRRDSVSGKVDFDFEHCSAMPYNSVLSKPRQTGINVIVKGKSRSSCLERGVTEGTSMVC